jgi:hypothetical protein
MWQLTAAFVGFLALGSAASAQTADLYLADNTRFDDGPSVPARRLPVLFVHGHNTATDESTNPNYRKNWQDVLPSFKQTLDLMPENDGLGIEAYYIRFLAQGRSITEDAAEISNAVERILHRHDSNYPTNPTHVQIVIIAYSKGTISTRQYLKSLQEVVPGLPPPRPNFRPVSEFIAIAPPNHGINVSGFGGLTSISGQQLLNGYGLANCTPFGFLEVTPPDFIEHLNGHPIGDTEFDPSHPAATPNPQPSEAPGSRADMRPTAGGTPVPNPPTAGTLYVTIFADNNRDFVGGNTIIGPAGADCQGRRLAKNLSPDAVNIPLNITGNDAASVHQNTVHTSEVICQALYAAVHHRSPEGQTCVPHSSGVPIITPPPRAAAMLTLDFSGSMAFSTGPNGTRAAVLKQAVEIFVNLWSAVSAPSDRIGVNYFRTNVEQFDVSGATLPPLSVGGAPLTVNMRDHQEPHDSTAMGSGLQQAIKELRDTAADARIRRVILFTDGIQNVNPMARIENHQLTFVNDPAYPSSPPSPGAPAFLDPTLDIAVDTIGIGASDLGLLQDIAHETSGHFLSTTDPTAASVRQFFVEELINALKGFSPQLIAYRRGNIASAGSTQTFPVEAGPHRLVLKLSWQRGDSMSFSVAKDGVDVTAAGRFIDGAFYKIFVIDLPAKGRSPITARGNWQVRIKGKATTAYEAAAIVDGGRITYDAVFNARRPKVGDPLELVVRSTAGGKPIGASAKVTATLMIPTTAVRDLIATDPPKEPPSFEPGMTLDERQLLAFTQDPKNWAKLKPKRQTVVLKQDGKGAFNTRISPKVPGIYTAAVTIDGEAAKIGKFSRTITATTVVRSPEPANPRK